jgi:ubiquinone/menaquinone biosynthesis C-methylase UbiE
VRNSQIKINYGRNFLNLNFLYSFLTKKKRDEIYKILRKFYKINKKTKLLDVGTTPSIAKHENILLNKSKWKKNITCLSNLKLDSLKKLYPEVRFCKGDARKMKFKKNSFDLVFSSATIEHVGSFKNQVKFVNECYRVANYISFITTPNRNYPIDFHTRLPLIHLLPKKIHRNILNFFGEKYLSKESNLNLLTENDLINICKKNHINNFKIIKIKLFFLVSNLVLIIRKNS